MDFHFVSPPETSLQSSPGWLDSQKCSTFLMPLPLSVTASSSPRHQEARQGRLCRSVELLKEESPRAKKAVGDREVSGRLERVSPILTDRAYPLVVGISRMVKTSNRPTVAAVYDQSCTK